MTDQTPQIDAARAEEFGGRVVGWLNGGALAMMFSVGHRTGLFDRLAGLPASSSADIAGAAGLASDEAHAALPAA